MCDVLKTQGEDLETHAALAFTDQASFELRCEWGAEGIAMLAPAADVLVIVDVLSFTTGVSVAMDQGAQVFPYRYGDAGAAAYAQSLSASLAVPREQTSDAQPYSLSPVSLSTLPTNARIVLPSPNGSALAFLAADSGTQVLGGCLRNADATASYAARHGSRIAVIPAGERWGRDSGAFRAAVEDWLGAGAILEALHRYWPTATVSPEAAAAIAAFHAARWDLPAQLAACASGRELREGGYADDVLYAAALNASECAAVLIEGAFVAR